MPRYFDRTRKPLATTERQERIKKSRRYRLGVWIDPYPSVPGTKPEKIVFAALMARKIPFVYQAYHRVQIANIDDWFRPDFVIPGAKIILEVDGFYWHSQPDQIEEDALRRALYQASGYKVISWWDFEIEARIDELMASVDEFRPLLGKGGRIFTGHELIIDDSAGIRTANQARTDYGKRQARYSMVGRRKAKSSYAII